MKFDLQTLNRPPVEFTKVVVVDGVASVVLDEEKTKPVLGDFDLGVAEFDSAAVSVENVVPGLLYGLGRAETPAGPYVVDEWVRAKPGEAVSLTAPKVGSSGSCRIKAREGDFVKGVVDLMICLRDEHFNHLKQGVSI